MPFANIFYVLANNIEALVSNGGYLFLALFTVAEGIPIIGMFIPGHIAVVFAGFLAKMGTLDIWWVIIIAIISAITGDFIGFYLGRKYGISLIDRFKPYFFITDAKIDEARSILATHSGKAMIIGRFIPATRALMPFLVGSTRMPAGKFWFYNIIGGISWVASSIFLGYLFGASYAIVSEYAGKFIVGAILGVIVILWGYRFVNIHFRVFRRYELITLLINILSLWTLAVTLQGISSPVFKLNFDVWVNAFMDRLNDVSYALVFLADWISTIGGTVVVGTVATIVSGWLLLHRKWRSGAIMILSVGITAFFVAFLKQLFLSPRPQNALELIVNDPSFPSGHAALAAAFFFSLAYIFAPRIRSTFTREMVIVGCVLAVITIGASRLVLNVHWMSDVVAGWSLGILVSTSSILFVRYIVGTLSDR